MTSSKCWSCTKGRKQKIWNAGWFFVIPKTLNIGLFVYALYNRNLQHEDSLRKAFSRTDTANSSPISAFCTEELKTYLHTFLPALTLLNPAIFMMQTLERRAAFVDSLRIKGMSSVPHPHLFFQIWVQVEMLDSVTVNHVKDATAFAYGLLFFPAKNSLTACNKFPCLKIKVSKSMPKFPDCNFLPRIDSDQGDQCREICLFWNCYRLPSA